MGSISRVQVFYEDLTAFLQEHNTVPVYAAALDGTSLYDLPAIQSGIILVGNESKGIRPEIMELAKHHVTIRRVGRAESLNAAVATGLEKNSRAIRRVGVSGFGNGRVSATALKPLPPADARADRAANRGCQRPS